MKCADSLDKILKKYSIVPIDHDEDMKKDMDYGYMYSKLFEVKVED